MIARLAARAVRVVVFAFATFAATTTLASASALYILYGPAVNSANIIGSYDDATNTVTQLGTLGAGVTLPARNLAQIGNNLYFIDNKGILFSFNLTSLATTRVGQTSAFTTSPARLGSDEFGRLVTFDTSSANIYYISPTTGATLATYALTGATATDTGDIAITPNGTIYELFGTSVYTIPATGGAVTLLTSNAGIASTFSSVAFDPNTGQLIAGNQTGTFYVIDQTTGAATLLATANLGNGNAQLNDMASVFVSPQVSLSKSHTGTFPIGSTGTFTLQVSNASNYTTAGVITVTDTLPAGLTYASATGTGWTCSASGQVVTCTTSAAIAAGAKSNPISLVVNVGGSPGNVTNNATASGGGEPAALPPATASDTAATAYLANISIAKTGTTNAPPGGSISYSIVVNNAGPSPASNTTVSDPVPNGVTIAGTPTCTASGGAICGTVTVSGQNVTTTIPTFPSGGSITLAINATAPTVGNYKNTATVTPDSSVTDTNGTTSSSVTTTVSATNALSKTVRNVTTGQTTGVTANTGKPGDVLEYGFTFTNNTASTLSNFTLSDAVPANTTYVSGACGTVPTGVTSCTVNGPAVGGTGSVTFTYAGTIPIAGVGTFTLRVKIN